MLNLKSCCRKTLYPFITVLYAVTIFISCGLHAPRGPSADYSPLIDFIRLKDKSAPVYAFNEFKETFDNGKHKAALDYLSNRRALIERIKSDLDTTTLNWRLDAFEQRLLYVPEMRPEYADLYEHYCTKAIDFTLEKTGFDNPYIAVETLGRTKPVILEDGGVTVFLVHNLAEEYVGTYSFFNEKRPQKIQISLRGLNFTGEVGSYASRLTVGEDGWIEFERDNFTIWQNSARSPYNALIVPIEETLHITLRPFTEKAIRHQLSFPPKYTIKELKQVVNHWMSIEEAIVGGIVDVLFAQIVEQYINRFPEEMIEIALTEKSRNQKYRYLLRGIDVVKTLGVDTVIDMYKRNPGEFRDRVMSDLPAQSAGRSGFSERVHASFQGRPEA